MCLVGCRCFQRRLLFLLLLLLLLLSPLSPSLSLSQFLPPPPQSGPSAHEKRSQEEEEWDRLLLIHLPYTDWDAGGWCPFHMTLRTGGLGAEEEEEGGVQRECV